MWQWGGPCEARYTVDPPQKFNLENSQFFLSELNLSIEAFVI